MKNFCFRFIAEEGIKVEFVQATPTEVVFKVCRDDAQITKNDVEKIEATGGTITPEKVRKLPIDKERLIQLWNEGLPAKAIAEELGTTEGTVYAYASKLGCRKHNNKQCPKRFAEMWNAGCSVAEIASELNISKATIHRWVKKIPECIPHAKRPTAKKQSVKCVVAKQLVPDKLAGKMERFVQMWNSCAPIAEIANEFGVHVATIHRWANKIPECISPEEKAQKRAAKNQVTPNLTDDTTSTPTAEAIPNHQNTSASENWPKSGERLRQNEIAALCKMWEDGQHNITELARYFQVSRSTIYYQLRVNGCRGK